MQVMYNFDKFSSLSTRLKQMLHNKIRNKFITDECTSKKEGGKEKISFLHNLEKITLTNN